GRNFYSRFADAIQNITPNNTGGYGIRPYNIGTGDPSPTKHCAKLLFTTQIKRADNIRPYKNIRS
ncbi:MAG: hypothetical protein J6C96_07485, partial [Oscillospiraceae bacterium]|nr:hypothetical protein [Oscillospiraceae bacterium]